MSGLFNLYAPSRDLPSLFAGRPLIIADSRLPDGVALHAAGAGLCRAEFAADGIILRLAPPVAQEALVPLEHAPAAVIALVTPTPRGMAALAEWWPRHSVPAPPVIVAEGGLAALPALLAAVLAAADRDAARICGLEEQLAALRAESEHLREAVAALLGTLGGQPVPVPETRLATAPDPAAPALQIATGETALTVEPGLPTAGVARVSLHLAAAATADLAVRLVGAETGRILCAWHVPGNQLGPGWLHLETPEPVSGRPETLLLHLAAIVADPHTTGTVPLTRAVGAPDDPALAFATLPPGARLVQPRHMDWTAWQDDAPPGIPRLAPCQALAEARLDGPGDLGGPDGAGRRLDLAQGWGATRIDFGPLPENGAAVRCDIALEGSAIEARLRLHAPDAETEWRVMTPGQKRPFALPIPGGAPALSVEFRGTGTAVLTLTPPVIFPRMPEPAAAPDAPMAAAPAPRVVTAQPLRALEGSYPRETSLPAQPRGGADAAQPGGAGLLTAPDAERVPSFTEVVLDARQSGSGWELLDLRVRGLVFRGERWRELKYKFGIAGPDVILEFRRAPSWPRTFEAWPGTESDAYGDKFVLVLTAEAVLGLDRVAPGRDATLVAALAAIMPRVVAEVLTEREAEACAVAAGRLAARLGGSDLGAEG